MQQDDPNEAYSVEPIADGELMASAGWVVVKCNGIPQWYAPPGRAHLLATNAVMRAEARRSKMHHDVKPT